MDFITSCYYSRMRPYRDRPDIEVAGRWHWCPEGARPIPFMHRFGSHTMDPDGIIRDGPVGEIPQKNGRSRGESNPRYTGLHFCGTKEDWEQGSLFAGHVPPPVDEEGVPVCCDAAPLNPGGVELDGEAEQYTTGGGGGELGGSAVDPDSTEIVADGGGELGGVGHPQDPFEYHAQDGGELGGTSPPVYVPYEPETPSDTEIGGDGSRPLQRVVYAEGGVEVDGDGSRPLQRVVYAEGGVEVDGDGSAPFATEIKADGGGELGEAEGPFATEIKADGGGELGEAEGPFATEIKADGGVEIGAAADGAGTVLIGACSNPIKRTLWQTQPFTVNPADFPCWIDHARWLKLVYSDVTESWEGAAAFGACGRSWAVSIKWIGPGPDVWRVSVRWTPGPERSDEGPQTGLVCNPFSLTTVGFTVTGTDIGAEPAAGDLFFNLFIVDTPQP